MSLTAKGTISKVGDAVVLMVNKENAVGIHLPASPAWVGTLQAQGTVDGMNWFNIPLFGGISTTTGSGYWPYIAHGMTGVRLIATAWTSGTLKPAMISIGYGASFPTGMQVYSFVPTGTDQILISANARKFWGCDIYTIDATPVYLKIYDKATTPASTDTPVYRSGSPANPTSTLGAGNNKGPWTNYVPLANGLGIRAVADIADSGTSALTTAENYINVFYSD